MGIVDNGILVDMNISLWSGHKMDKQVGAEVDQAKSTKTKAGAYYKNLFAGTDKLEKVRVIAGRIRNWHLTQTLPWNDYGTRLLPMGNFLHYKQELTKLEAVFDAAVQDFVADYDTLISAAAFQIGALFNRDDYPASDKVALKFGIKTAFHPVPQSGDFRIDSDEETKKQLRDDYEKAYRAKEEATARELWDKLHDYLTLLVERLDKKQQAAEATANGEKTKAGVFHESHLDNGAELCGILSRLNIMNDPQLDAARKYLEAALSGITIKDIRTSEGTRTMVKTRVQDILDRFCM